MMYKEGYRPSLRNRVSLDVINCNKEIKNNENSENNINTLNDISNTIKQTSNNVLAGIA